MKELWRMFRSFFKIGVFTFGGGYAMIPLIEREVIDNRGWIDRDQFMELLTLAQSAPGPISLNTSVFVGYKMRGYAGALAALAGVVLPSFTIILVIAIYFSHIRDNAVVDAAFKGMRPAVVALIISPIISLARGMGIWRYAIAALTAVAIWHWGFSPILLILAAAAAGLIAELYNSRKNIAK